jgi:hypothetical protein
MVQLYEVAAWWVMHALLHGDAWCMHGDAC